MDSCVRLLPDYAEQPNGSGMALEKVGIKNYQQYQRDFSGRRTLTTQSAYVDLLGKNGIHMSRLSGILQEYADKPIEIQSDLLEALANSHNTTSAYWECNWSSGHEMANEQLIFIKCMLEGIVGADKEDWFLTMNIPYASVCPCATEMCDRSGSGVPHMQRAEARITGLLDPEDNLNELLTTMVARTLDAVVLVPIPFMKRPQELEWCQRAEDTTLFVEDASRVIGRVIDGFMEDWVVVCNHFESIHQHDVVSVCRKGKKLV